MSNSSVQILPDSTGKLVQTFLNNVGGFNVHAQGSVLVDPTGLSIVQTAGSAMPAAALAVGASDGTNMRSLLVESASVFNLRTGLWQGASQATIAAFHNQDNQNPGGGTAFGMLTGGVAQLLNQATGFLDRQRETGSDNISAVGIPTGTQQLKSLITISQTVTVSNGATTFTPSGGTAATLPGGANVVKYTAPRGNAAAWIAVGSVLTFEPGTNNQERVLVTAISGGGVVTFTPALSASHTATFSISFSAYNEARDATTADGSGGIGFQAGATYLFNGILNSLAGGWEAERSAAGELDGASGSGTNIAAEYEFNSGGPIGAGNVPIGSGFDRARNLWGKGLGQTTVNGTVGSGVTSVTLTAVVGLTAGQAIVLSPGTARAEILYVANNYVPGTLAVTLATQTQLAHNNGDTVYWDSFANASTSNANTGGPGLNGFLATGIGIEEEALYDPVSGLFFIERAATQDGVSAQNVVMENPGLWNGATVDRQKGTNGAAQVIHTAQAVGGATHAKQRNLAATVQSVKASAGTLYGVQVVNTSGATAFVQIFDVASGSVTLGTTTPDLEVQVATASTVSLQLPGPGIAMTTAISVASTTTEGGLTGSAAGVQVFLQYA